MVFKKKPFTKTGFSTPGFMNKINLIEILLSIVLILITTGMLLWNWDGFWQTEIPALKNAQISFFPAKYSGEQNKLSNLKANAQDLGQLVDKIIELELENAALNNEIESLTLENNELQQGGLETAETEAPGLESDTAGHSDGEGAVGEPGEQTADLEAALQGSATPAAATQGAAETDTHKQKNAVSEDKQ